MAFNPVNNLTGSARFAPVDGVRGIAVLFVFFSHTSGRGMYLHPSLNFQGIGHIGVYLFFCLSAYLLAGKLFEEGIDSNSVRRFYIKRFFRIVPLYYLVLFGVFAVQYFTGHYDERFLHIKYGLTGLLQHLVFYRGDGVFWSVVVEEQFYILVPLWIYLFIRFRKLAVAAFALIALVNFTLYICKYLHWPVNTDLIRLVTTNDRSSGNYIDIFIATIIAVYFEKKYAVQLEKYKRPFGILTSILFVLLVGLTLILVSKHFLIFQDELYKFRYLSLLYAIVFSLFIVSVRAGNPLNRLLSFAPLRLIGIFGFSVYLLHFLVFELVGHLDVPHYIRFLIAGAGVFVLSAVCYYLIEKPFIRLSYKLINRLGLEQKKPDDDSAALTDVSK